MIFMTTYWSFLSSKLKDITATSNSLLDFMFSDYYSSRLFRRGVILFLLVYEVLDLYLYLSNILFCQKYCGIPPFSRRIIWYSQNYDLSLQN